MIQTTLFQLDNYGPWTVTPSPKPEMSLQALQSRIYAYVAKQVGRQGGYAFYARGDNVIAVTNGLSRDDHARIQAEFSDRFPVTTSVSIGTGATPAESLAAATERLQAAGSAQDPERTAVLCGETLDPRTDPEVHVAHFDVVRATEEYTDDLDAFSAFLDIGHCYLALSRHMYRTHDALTFFVGGDNFVAICPPLSDAAYADAIEQVADKTGVAMKVGVKNGRTSRVAGAAAKHALEVCREQHSAVVRSDGHGGHEASAD